MGMSGNLVEPDPSGAGHGEGAPWPGSLGSLGAEAELSVGSFPFHLH